MEATRALARESERLLEGAFPTPSGRALQTFRRNVKDARASMGGEMECSLGSENVTCRFPFAPSNAERTWRVRLPTKDAGVYGCSPNLEGEYRCWKRMRGFTSPVLAVYDWLADRIVATIGDVGGAPTVLVDMQNVVLEEADPNEPADVGAARVLSKLREAEVAILIVVHGFSRVTEIARRVLAARGESAKCVSVKARCASSDGADDACVVRAEGNACALRSAPSLSDHAFCSADDSALLALAMRIGAGTQRHATRVVTQDRDLGATAAWFLEAGWEARPLDFACATVAGLHAQQFLTGGKLCLRRIGAQMSRDEAGECHVFVPARAGVEDE